MNFDEASVTWVKEVPLSHEMPKVLPGMNSLDMACTWARVVCRVRGVKVVQGTEYRM